ncbi:MAG: M48 family metallopeptidase [candidate division WOR-3 bacterium]
MGKEIHPLLDKEKQEKAKVYEWIRRKIGLWSMLLSGVFNILFYFSGFSHRIASTSIFPSVILVFIFYMFIYAGIQEIISLPISYLSGFVIEKKYGFSNQTRGEWVKEHGKSFLVSLVISIIIFGALIYIFQKFGDLWWLVSSLFMVFFSVVMSMVCPVWIMPIFHKYEPIEDEELKNSLLDILEKGGLKIKGFFREDTSKTTKKENAMLAGLGKTKRVILTDNIINNLVFTVLFPDFLTGVRANIALLPIFLLSLNLIDLALLKILQNAMVRRFEEQADFEALSLSEDPEAFKRAMAGLANRNLSNAYPDFWVKLIYYSHPPVGERLQKAEEYLLDTG